ncbi:hypothetical protein CAPTEDRAFT_170589 [Capitella teleta]|uniref:Transporter n=1 Tax=Capitella teleta TaxID=283909 RepID=R7TM92_CAPTE|nr:hypothetical protein CAPTEDRAFT_170589 [Capitella teleta]|eukprot:ELT92205.1 hypothetical protein CAPTEDRAFT_170589 [Capitella teleta]
MTADGAPKRETWARKFDFLLACVGFSIGFGNVWRFPFLCYKNGGGAFLIPYLICVVVGGVPLFFLEVAIGQFMAQGGVNAWLIVPLFQGVGYACTVIVFFLNCYYNVILAWALYYLFASFTTELPWDSCGNSWNTYNCTMTRNSSLVGINTTFVNGTELPYKAIDPTTEYWENKVLAISDGIDQPGNIKWDLMLCLLLAWVIVYFCIWKGIKTSGKVMYFTATSPYVLMFILLIRGCTLDGAKKGILYYLVPDFKLMQDMGVWVDAGTQIFFSYSISLGALTALGSYNKWNHNSYIDSLLFASFNSGTSIFSGFVIFSVLGYMADKLGTTVADVAESGPGLAFIAYPAAVARMPVAPLWSILFFIMLILLGLDSQFVGVEGLITPFMDAFPKLREKGKREGFIAILCFIQFMVGLSMVTNGGMYVFQLFDYYTGSRIILLVAFFECIAISYFYGVNRFYDNLEMMFGYRIDPWMKVSWVLLSPIFCMSVFVMSSINYSELSYERPSGDYKYPDWAVGIGWFLASLSAICIPILAIYHLVKFSRAGRPWDVLKPQLHEHQLRPQDKKSSAYVSNEMQSAEAPPPYAAFAEKGAESVAGHYDNPGYVTHF